MEHFADLDVAMEATAVCFVDDKGEIVLEASVTDPLYRVTAYAYDALSRRISVSNPAIQATPLLAQSYTPDGLIASLTDAADNTTSFTPDGFDRLATTTYPDGSSEVLSYDADGNVLTRQTRAGAIIAFSYDTLNRLSTKTAPSEATVRPTTPRAGAAKAAPHGSDLGTHDSPLTVAGAAAVWSNLSLAPRSF